MSFTQYALNRDNKKRRTEYVNWGESFKDNNSYIVTNEYSSSFIGLIDMDNPRDKSESHENNKMLNGVILKLNKNCPINAKQILGTVDYTIVNKSINEIDIKKATETIIKEAFPDNWKEINDSIKFGCSRVRSVERDNNNLWKRQYNYNVYINKYIRYSVGKNTLNFESKLNVKELFPLKENISKLKEWVINSIEDITATRNFNIGDMEAINFLINDDGWAEYRTLDMNKTLFSKMMAIKNRINLDKVKETLETEKEKISNLTSIMEELHEMMINDYNSNANVSANLLTPVNITIKGINFRVSTNGVFVDVVGDYIKTRVSEKKRYNYIRDSNKPILDRCIAYIVSLGNEHELLETKIEEKLLMRI